MSSAFEDVFTATSAYSLGVTVVILFAALAAAKVCLPKDASGVDRFTFVWLAFAALIHFLLEGPFIYLSTFGRTVHSSSGLFATFWSEYAKADIRWGEADACVVSLEMLTVLGSAPLCCFILYQLAKGDPARHYWIVVLSTVQIYGGYMSFVPEWLVGSPNLVTSNWMYTWLYLVFFNSLWVIIPLYLTYDSYSHIASTLRSTTIKPKAE